MTAVTQAQSGKGHLQEDSAEEGELSAADENLKLRKLKQATAKSARLRITNPFQAKADAATSAHWGSDRSSARALEQQQHEGSMLLQSGFNARDERRKHHSRKRGKGTSNSSSR